MYLQNDDIRLRALEPEDLDALYKWENDTDIWTISNAVEPYSRYILKEYIAYSDKTIYEKKQLRLMIELKNTDEAIGAIDIYDFDAHNLRAGIGILIENKYRQKGYAGMAVDLVTEYCFNFLHLNQLYAHVTSTSGASRILFSNHGFKQSGVLRSWLHEGSGFVDVEIFQLLKNSPNVTHTDFAQDAHC